MSNRTYRSLQILILAALGAFLLYKIWSGTLYWYINQRFAFLTLLASLGLLAMAQVSFTALRQKREADHDHEHDPHDHEHDHPAGRLPVWPLVIVALPILIGLIIPAKPLGATAVANRGVNTSAPLVASGSTRATTLDMAPEERNVLDWVRAFNYSSDPQTFVGQPADVIGFVYHDRRLTGTQFLTGRFAVSCCVADAMAIGVVTEWRDSTALADNSWVRVRGTIKVAQVEGKPIPLIIAKSVEPTPTPELPYLFP